MSFTFNAKAYASQPTTNLWVAEKAVRCFVMAAKEVVTQKGDSAITIQFKALDGANLNRQTTKYFMQTCVGTPAAVEWARADLASLCMAIGLDEINDVTNFNGYQFLCDVSIVFNKKRGEEENKFRFLPKKIDVSNAASMPTPEPVSQGLDDIPF